MISEFISENKGAIAFTIAFLMLGAAVYFFGGNLGGLMANEKAKGAADLFDGIRYKAEYASDGRILIFANAKNNALSKMKVSSGNPIPEDSAIVIGSAEAERASAQGKNFTIGKKLAGFYGINTSVEGILAKTGGPADSIYFLGETQFEKITGEEGKIFTKVKDGEPEMFFTLKANDTLPKKFALSEGSMDSYAPIKLGNKWFYPIVMGSNEAKSMRDEKLFSAVGDSIKDFFGKDMIVFGVLKETNTSIDDMHFTTLNEKELK